MNVLNVRHGISFFASFSLCRLTARIIRELLHAHAVFHSRRVADGTKTKGKRFQDVVCGNKVSLLLFTSVCVRRHYFIVAVPFRLGAEQRNLSGIGHSTIQQLFYFSFVNLV